MLRRFGLKFTLFLVISDLVWTNVALYLARHLRIALDIGLDVGPRGEWLHFGPILFLIVTAIWLIIFNLMSVYDTRRTLRAIDDMQIVAVGVMVATLVFAGVAYFFFREFSRFLFVYFFLLDLIFLVFWRVLLRVLFRLRWGGWQRETRPVLIVGAGRVGRKVCQALQAHAWTGLRVVGYLDDNLEKQGADCGGLPVIGTLDDVCRVAQARQISQVIITLPLRAHARVRELVAALQDFDVHIRVVPDYFDMAFVRARVEDFGGIPLLSLREPVLDDFQRLVKRVFDLALGGMMTIVAAPIMLAVAILIKLDSPGPILFRQERVGENGKRFRMYKFRSMVQNAEKRAQEIIHRDENGQLIYKEPDDPRVTRVGQIIRRTSLDELPQLFNVLKGEMSLVGPRPEMPWVLDEYEPWQFQRFAVPQGITGWWQVNGRSDKPMHLHTEEDLYYVKNYSLLLDLIILWKTVGAVLKRKGAY